MVRKWRKWGREERRHEKRGFAKSRPFDEVQGAAD